MFPFLVAPNLPWHAQPLLERPVERGGHDLGDGLPAVKERFWPASGELPELSKRVRLRLCKWNIRTRNPIPLLHQPPWVPPIVEEWPNNPEDKGAYAPSFQATGNTKHLIKAKCQPIAPEAGRNPPKNSDVHENPTYATLYSPLGCLRIICIAT